MKAWPIKFVTKEVITRLLRRYGCGLPPLNHVKSDSGPLGYFIQGVEYFDINDSIVWEY